MNVDPSGCAFLTAFLISMGIAALIGGAFAGVDAYQSGERGWDLVADIAGGVIFGAAIGATIALGGAAGLAATGASIVGYTLTLGQAIGVSLAIGTGAGLLSYTAETLISQSNQWSWLEFGKNGLSGLAKGATTFAIAFAGGKFGAFDKMFLEDILGKELVKNVFCYDVAKGMLANIIPSAGRQFFTQMSYYLGESLTKAVFVSSTAAVIRWIIDKIFGT